MNRAASWGSMFVDKPKHLKDVSNEPPPPKKSVFESSAGHRLNDGAVVQPKGVKQAAVSSKVDGKSAASASGGERKSEEKKSNKGDAKSARRPNPWSNPDFKTKGA